MPPTLAASITTRPDRICLTGGSPKGSDAVEREILSWAGWRRTLEVRQLGGLPASFYHAPLYPHTVQPVLSSTWNIIWDGETHVRAVAVATSSTEARLSLQRQIQEWPLPNLAKPFMHQWQAMEAIYLNPNALLADDMGLGKTKTALWAWHKEQLPRLLVICPASVKWNWDREIEQTLGPHNDLPVYVIDGSQKRRRMELDGMAEWMEADGPGGDLEGFPQQQVVCVINYDLLERLDDDDQQILKWWVEGQALICDESHYLRTTTSARSRFVRKQLAPISQWRLLLTGTPIMNTIEDLYNQIEILRPGSWVSKKDFYNRYVVTSRLKVGSVTQPVFKDVYRGAKNTAELNRIVNTLQIRRKKSEVTDLPPKVYTYPELHLEGQHLKLYQAMKEYALLALADLEDDTPILKPQAHSALEAAHRCAQIAQGFVGGIPEEYLSKVMPIIHGRAEKIPSRPKELAFPKSPKLDWVKRTALTLREQSDPVVIFGNYNAPLHWLTSQLPAAGLLHGAVESLQRQTLIDAFQNRELHILCIQVKLAQGFNLTRCHDVLFLGRSWLPGENVQAEDRCHRIGTKGTVNVQIPVVANSVERKLHKALIGKGSDAEHVLRATTVGQMREML